LSSFYQAQRYGACGEENACLCAQCLEAGLLTQAAAAAVPKNAPAGKYYYGYYGNYGYHGGGGGYYGRAVQVDPILRGSRSE